MNKIVCCLSEFIEWSFIVIIKNFRHLLRWVITFMKYTPTLIWTDLLLNECIYRTSLACITFDINSMALMKLKNPSMFELNIILNIFTFQFQWQMLTIVFSYFLWNKLKYKYCIFNFFYFNWLDCTTPSGLSKEHQLPMGLHIIICKLNLRMCDE